MPPGSTEALVVGGHDRNATPARFAGQQADLRGVLPVAGEADGRRPHSVREPGGAVCASAKSGHPPGGGSESGSVTTPVTTVGSPETVSEVYMIRCQLAPMPAGAPGTGWTRRSVPCSARGRGVGDFVERGIAPDHEHLDRTAGPGPVALGPGGATWRTSSASSRSTSRRRSRRRRPGGRPGAGPRRRAGPMAPRGISAHVPPCSSGPGP